MDDATFDQAASMLVDDPPLSDNVPDTPAPVVDTPVVQDQPNVDAPTVDAESFTSIDPSTLPPELVSVYKSMQADYTRKAQEAAAYRKLGADPDTLTRAYQFYQQMDTNPDYARQVADYIYQQMGVDPQATQDSATPDMADDTDFGFDDNVPSAVQKQMAEMQAALEQIQQERTLAQMEKMVLSQEATIRQQNTHYNQQDIDAIYEIAASMEVPDLLQAEERYTQLQAMWAQRYMSKGGASVPAPVAPGNAAQTPQKIDSLDQATAIGLDWLTGQNGQ